MLALGVFRNALGGPFVSDDFGYLVHSPYTSALSTENLLAIFAPWGPARIYDVGNYAPLHLLLTAIERQLFGNDVRGYHVVNVLLHALNATLLVALLLSSRLPRLAALVCGLLFLLHPANVEAVAWISQLKTSAALALALGALLVWPHRPALATLLFAAGLLTKAAVVFALPVAAALAWVRRGGPGQDRRSWVWLAGWALLLGLYALPQLEAFQQSAPLEGETYGDPIAHLRTIAAIGMRYLVMAATGRGVSAFHDPDVPVARFDLWWIAAIPASFLLGWRLLYTLRLRREESAYWLGAASAFVPVSQIFPFVIPLADRYLYFIFPGLLGGASFLALALGDWGAPRFGRGFERRLSRGVAAAALALATLFGVQASVRAGIWSSEIRLYLDSARNYPEGGTALFLAARREAQSGDGAAAVALLEKAAQRGVNRFELLRSDPGLAPIRGDPAFRALVAKLALRVIERARIRGGETQPELRMLAHAHLERDEYEQALQQLTKALAAGGPLSEVVRRELESVRSLQRAQRSPESP